MKEWLRDVGAAIALTLVFGGAIGAVGIGIDLYLKGGL